MKCFWTAATQAAKMRKRRKAQLFLSPSAFHDGSTFVFHPEALFTPTHSLRTACQQPANPIAYPHDRDHLCKPHSLMPKKELQFPAQVEAWLVDWGNRLPADSALILIGSGGLLWHAAQRGQEVPLPGNSMDVDPVTETEAVAELCYEALIGSEFELLHGWHVNLMPTAVLRELPLDWSSRAARKTYGQLDVTVPDPADLLAPKLRRGEPRDYKHAEWARNLGLL